jgi:hypothetical protein
VTTADDAGATTGAARTAGGVRRLLAALRARGLLLLQDRKLENAVALLAGETVSGSWWSHPRAGEMYEILETVGAHPDVLIAKLVAGKLTLVDRALFPALLAVATARAPWQTTGLTAEARRLLATLDEGTAIEPAGGGAKELELRLLARATSVHTPSGKHVTRLEPWPSWAARARCRATNLATAKRRLLAAVAEIGGDESLLPWAAQVTRRG